MAAADLIIGTELNNKKTKVASKIDDKKFDNLAGTPLSKDVKAYAKDLEKIGNLKISSEQKDLLNNALKGKKYKKLTDEEYTLHIKNFNKASTKKRMGRKYRSKMANLY